jgi:hypothetical protein
VACALVLARVAAADEGDRPAATLPAEPAAPAAAPADAAIAPATPVRPVASSEADQPPAAPADLRTGHWLFGVSGGVWATTSGLADPLVELGGLAAGGAAHAYLGVGIGRSVLLGLEGGIARAGTSPARCDGCGATSIDVGALLSAHLSQGLAFDPWVGYGLGYRHTMLSLGPGAGASEGAEPTTADGLDFARLSLGGDFYPAAWVGFGPYFEADLGVRPAERTDVYAIGHVGLRLTLDPLRADARVGPRVAAR